MFAFLYSIYYALIYQPFLNGLILLYNSVSFQDLGVAIILLTIAIRLLLFPLFQKSQRHQMLAQKIQPKLKKIQQDHKGDAQRQTEAMMALYKEHGFNPLAGFGLLFIQIPIMIALYNVFFNIFSPEIGTALYSFVSAPGRINELFLGLINLKEPSIVMVIVTAALQYFQGSLMQKHMVVSDPNDPSVKAARTMIIVGPLLTLVVFFKLPAAVALYWLISSIANILQQYLIEREKQSTKKA